MSNKFIKALSEWATRNDKKLNMDNLEADINSVEDVEQVVKQDESTLIKQFQSEERISVEILIEPDTIDAHGHWCSSETILKGKESFDKAVQDGRLPMNLFHINDVGEDQLKLVDNYILPTDCTIGETEVKKGTWVCEIFWANSELWELRKEFAKDEDGEVLLNEDGKPFHKIAGISYKGWGMLKGSED